METLSFDGLSSGSFQSVIDGESRRALGGFLLTLKREDYSAKTLYGRSDRMGKYVFAGVSPGKYTLELSRSGYRPESIPFVKPRESDATIDVSPHKADYIHICE